MAFNLLKNADARPKTEREILEKILKYVEGMNTKINDIEERLEELEENSAQGEVKELKDESKQYRIFMQDMMLKLIDAKNIQASKPSAVELYQMRKAEEAKAEASKPNGAGHKPRLP